MYVTSAQRGNTHLSGIRLLFKLNVLQEPQTNLSLRLRAYLATQGVIAFGLLPRKPGVEKRSWFPVDGARISTPVRSINPSPRLIWKGQEREMAKAAILHLGPHEYPPLRPTLESKFLYYPWWEVQEAKREAFLAEKGPTIRGILTDTKYPTTQSLLSRLPKLEIVSTISVGTDKVDLQYCEQHGVVVTNTPDVLTECVADTAMALLFATMRRTCVADRYVRDGKWPTGTFPITVQISGKKVGIIGLGRIGGVIASRVACFGCPVGYYSRNRKAEVPFEYFGSVVDLARYSEVLIAACPLTKETTKIVNREVLDALGPNGYFINIARGGVVDEAQLVQALVEGRLGGAGLDVFENEPHVPEELMAMDNVVLLPHVGSGTWETCKQMTDLAITNLEAQFAGKPVLTPVR